MTELGASVVPPQIAQQVAESLGYFVDIHELQALAYSVIGRATGAEGGCITASAAGGLAVSVAACMTGSSLGAVESLPDTSALKRRKVVIQKGHVVDFGGLIPQMIRLTGAQVVEVGTATVCHPYQLEYALDPETAAVVYVVSHHTVQSGLLGLGDVARLAHAAGVPVVVDAASEYDLRRFAALGADLTVFSAHKFLAGPTAGIVAGRKDLVRAAYLNQTRGLGRAMKVGKEGIAGAVAALERWLHLDHRALHEAEYRRVQAFLEGLGEVRGLRSVEVPDPTGNPITRVRVYLEGPAPAQYAAALALRLRQGSPAVAVRDNEVDQGYIELDPCNLRDEEVPIVLDRIRTVAEGLSDQIGFAPEESPAGPALGHTTLGPRYSTYTPEDLPGADLDRVPWGLDQAKLARREHGLLDWPDAWLAEVETGRVAGQEEGR